MDKSRIQFNEEWLVDTVTTQLNVFAFSREGYFFIENISEIYTLIKENMQISPFIISHYVAMAH